MHKDDSIEEGELFPEREVVLDEPELHDEQADALRAATDRAERAEAELLKMKNAAAHAPAPHKAAPTAASHETASAAGHAPVSHADAAPAHAASHATVGSGSGDAALKSPPSPNTRAAQEPEEEREAAEGHDDSEGVAELRNDSMMVHLLDSLDAGKDIGHYGRLVFAMVARHFLPHAEVLGWMTRDRDFSEEQATLMLQQVEGRDYSPPKRDRILEWQSQQEFPIIVNVDDPDCGNLYRNLKFPDEIYKHIGHYQEKKHESAAHEDAGDIQRF